MFEGNFYIPLKTDKRIYSYTPDSLKYSLIDKIWLKASKKSEVWSFTKLTILPNDFRDSKNSGFFIYEDWKTGKLSYEEYLKEKLFSPIPSKVRQNKASKDKKAKSNPNIPCKVISYSVCVGDEGHEICTTYLETVGNCNDGGSGGGDTGGGSGSGDPGNGGGHGGGGGNTPPIIYDCAGVISGSAYIGTCGKCIGGTTGISNCSELIDSLNNYPCAQSLLTQLPNLKNNIASIIKSQFVGTDDFSITFRAKQLPTNKDGQYNTNSPDMRYSTITLNSDILINSSKEYILVTMYHEALHAFLNLEERTLTPSEFSVKYPNLSKTGSNEMPRYYSDHNGFASFIDDLADAIVSFNPNIPYSDAIIMSKTGIVTNMTNQEILINQSYKTGTNGQKCN